MFPLSSYLYFISSAFVVPLFRGLREISHMPKSLYIIVNLMFPGWNPPSSVPYPKLWRAWRLVEMWVCSEAVKVGGCNFLVLELPCIYFLGLWERSLCVHACVCVRAWIRETNFALLFFSAVLWQLLSPSCSGGSLLLWTSAMMSQILQVGLWVRAGAVHCQLCCGPLRIHLICTVLYGRHTSLFSPVDS